jgi:hypothetical protein
MKNFTDGTALNHLLLKGEGKPGSFLHVSVLFDSAKAIEHQSIRSGTAPFKRVSPLDEAAKSPSPTPNRPPISKLITSYLNNHRGY